MPRAPESTTAGRPQSLGEEIANSATHGMALLGSVAALPMLVPASDHRGDAWQLVGDVVFGVTLVLLYLASTLYHALPACTAKRVMRVLDLLRQAGVSKVGFGVSPHAPPSTP